MAGPELTTKCPRCGETVPLEDGECPECGEELSFLTAMALGCVVGLVGLAAGWWLHPAGYAVALLGLLYAGYAVLLSKQMRS